MKIKVYIKIDVNKCITKIESSISELYVDFSKDWIKIDEGIGDKYAHAQGSYLEKGLTDSDGKYNYKYENSTLVELTDEEKETLFPAPTPEPNAQDILNAQLLKSKAEITTQLDNQKTLNAQLLLDIAKLKGGN